MECCDSNTCTARVPSGSQIVVVPSQNQVAHGVTFPSVRDSTLRRTESKVVVFHPANASSFPLGEARIENTVWYQSGTGIVRGSLSACWTLMLRPSIGNQAQPFSERGVPPRIAESATVSRLRRAPLRRSIRLSSTPPGTFSPKDAVTESSHPQPRSVPDTLSGVSGPPPNGTTDRLPPPED